MHRFVSPLLAACLAFAAGIAQAAARTSALNATLESDNFHDCSKRKRRLATKPSGERSAILRPADTAEEPSNRRFLQ